jgi:pimeloyl-ACP methyl ester carboxylesterase
VDGYRLKERRLWEGASPREHVLELRRPGIRVRVLEVGDGRPALFVHGVMTAGSSFAPLATRMKGVRCLVIDRPGCGLSEPWTLEGPTFRSEAVTVLEALLDALGLPRADLVGNSLGALWSTWFAIERPERIGRLALVGPSAGMPGVHVPLFLRLLSVLLGPAFVRKPMDAKTLRKIFADMGHEVSLQTGLVSAELISWGVELSNQTPTRRNELQILRRAVGLAGMRRWARLSDDELRRVRAPTLIVSGELDTHGGPRVAARVGALVPGAITEIVDEAGHLPWLDRPDRVAASLSRFLTDHGAVTA